MGPQGAREAQVGAPAPAIPQGAERSGGRLAGHPGPAAQRARFMFRGGGPAAALPWRSWRFWPPADSAARRRACVCRCIFENCLHFSMYPSVHPSIHPSIHLPNICICRPPTAGLGETQNSLSLGTSWPGLPPGELQLAGAAPLSPGELRTPRFPAAIR